MVILNRNNYSFYFNFNFCWTGSGQQTSDKNELNDTTDDSTQVLDDKKKKGGSESVDTADQHPQDDSLNKTEELNNSIFNREPSTQVIKDTTIAISVQMMLENSDWMSSPGSLPPLENLKQQSQASPYRTSTPAHIANRMDTENIINAAVYKKQKSDPTSLKVPEDLNQTDAESIEIPNEDENDNSKNKEDNNSTRKRKRVSPKFKQKLSVVGSRFYCANNSVYTN